MSTKTLRKRVALVAVAAMGLGLLSATSASAAAELTYKAADSNGVLAQSINGKLLTGTATMLTTGQIAVDVAAGTGRSYTKVSAGAQIQNDTTETVAANQLSATSANAAAGVIKVKTTLAAGSTFTITSYDSADGSGNPIGMVLVTVAAESLAGAVSASKSTVTWAATATLGLGTGGVDSATANTTTAAGVLYLNVQLKDAYGAAITSSTGALVVTASTGATVGITGAGTFSTTVSGADPSNLNVHVKEATSGAGWSGTVSVTYNGVAVATKSGSITGNVASLVIANNKIGKIGASNVKQITFVAKDAAGNNLATTTASDVKFSSSSNTGVVSTLAGSTNSTTSEAGGADVTCGVAGTANVVAQFTIASSGVVVKSNSLAVLCGGAADTYALTLDKAKYAQGDVATATLTFKDIKGNLANSYDSATSLNGAKDSISFPMAKQIGSITGAEVADSKGQISYKFNVGDVASFSAGKYNVVATWATPANGAAQTAAFEVSGAGGVSNSDILASIVKLITAINKQIAALQKLLLKR